jgi:predicted patatin/cPLA2 family phospholipase
VALALEGGGMRGVVSGATLIALKDAGLTDHVDVFYGTSSGSINVTYFAAGGSWDALSVYYDHLPFGFVRRPTHRSARLDMTFLERVMRERVPLDTEQLHQSDIDVRVVVTDVHSTEPRIVEMRSDRDPVSTLLASSWLPLLAGPPPRLDDAHLLDGGLLWADPVYAALHDGCTHILAINTSAKPAGSEHSQRLRFVLRALLNRSAPGLGDAYAASRLRWDRDKAALIDGAVVSMGDASVTRFAPRTRSHEVERLTLQRDRLLEGARAGYALGLRIAGRAPSRLVFSITPSDLRDVR